MVIQLEGNDEAAWKAIVELVGKDLAKTWLTYISLEGSNIRESIKNLMNLDLQDDQQMLQPWVMIDVEDRPECDRSVAGFLRFIKTTKMPLEHLIAEIEKGEYFSEGTKEWVRRGVEAYELQQEKDKNASSKKKTSTKPVEKIHVA